MGRPSKAVPSSLLCEAIKRVNFVNSQTFSRLLRRIKLVSMAGCIGQVPRPRMVGSDKAKKGVLAFLGSDNIQDCFMDVKPRVQRNTYLIRLTLQSMEVTNSMMGRPRWRLARKEGKEDNLASLTLKLVPSKLYMASSLPSFPGALGEAAMIDTVLLRAISKSDLLPPTSQPELNLFWNFSSLLPLFFFKEMKMKISIKQLKIVKEGAVQCYESFVSHRLTGPMHAENSISLSTRIVNVCTGIGQSKNCYRIAKSQHLRAVIWSHS